MVRVRCSKSNYFVRGAKSVIHENFNHICSQLLGDVAYKRFHVTYDSYVKSSVCLSVRPSVRLSVTLMYYDHIGWKS